jgi:hypothetical protein
MDGNDFFGGLINEEGLKVVDEKHEPPQVDQIYDEVVVDKVDDPPKTDPKDEPEKVIPELDYSVFSKKFGGEWDEGKIKEVIEKGSKYEASVTEIENHKKRVAELEVLETKLADPLTYFSSEDAYIREQFLMKNKDTDPAVLSVLTNLSPNKIEKLSDFEAITTKMLIDNPDIEGGKDGVLELLGEKYSLTPEELADGENLERVVKNKIKLEAKNAKSDLKKMYEGIEVPKKADISAARTSIKSSWETPLKEIIKGIDRLKVTEGIDFIITDDMKDGLFEEHLIRLTNNLTGVSEETAVKITGEIRDRLLLSNMDKIAETIEKDLREKIKAEVRAEIHNTNPLNNQTRERAAAKTITEAIADW